MPGCSIQSTAEMIESEQENMSTKDKIFSEKMDLVDGFKFDNKVAGVFDDMLSRSVPFYDEMQRMIREIAKDFAIKGTSVYDLGCSTGTTLLNLDQDLDPSIKFVGIDYSQDMLDKCKGKFQEHNLTRPHELVKGDLNQGVEIENASVVIFCLTLQFVRPLYRETLIRSVCEQMNESSCLILIEKVLAEDSILNSLFIKYYYDMKRRNHYSDIEISQKREALENVLVPYKLLENRELLIRSGFRFVDTFFKWYNFSGMVAVK